MSIKYQFLGLENSFLKIICFFLIAILPISPLVSFFSAVFLLINSSTKTSKSVRLCLALVAAVASSLLVAATSVDMTEAQDARVYYEIYERLMNNDLGALKYFVGGLEGGFPLLIYSWVLLIPTLTFEGFLFLTSLVSLLIMIYWIESSFYQSSTTIVSPALMGASLLMINVFMAVQLSRQFLSLELLLFAISTTKKTRKIIFLSLSSFFHLSALPFYMIFKFSRRGWIGWVGVFFLCLLLTISFAEMVNLYAYMPSWGQEKAAYYLQEGLRGFTEVDMKSLLMTAILAFMTILSVINRRKFNFSRDQTTWMVLPWAVGFIQILLLPIPLASVRASLMLTSVIPGLIAYRILSAGNNIKLLVYILNVYLVYKFSKILMNEKLFDNYFHGIELKFLFQ